MNQARIGRQIDLAAVGAPPKGPAGTLTVLCVTMALMYMPLTVLYVPLTVLYVPLTVLYVLAGPASKKGTPKRL